MATGMFDTSKLKAPGGRAATEFEARVDKELQSLALSNTSLKDDLGPLQFVSAAQIDVDGGKKAIILFVPFTQLARYRKIQKNLVEELEKKFSGNHVVIIGKRTIYKATYNRNTKFNGPRPRSRTLKHVQEAILDDIVSPSVIAGKRTLMRTDGSRLMKVQLSGKDNVEQKLETFASVYRHLCSKAVTFHF
eukprot:CAMPEP_0185579516 /NCGR_PEP_ID=MMETSP0434-20130131/15049_1 /TAXON_ID=626734 ORGANISM="Favella taraikaensis, Strain Fe Narragansett Bay" /NCGR_SAMPLE_ID=MMETSP0434 /ASSEMBLY_ACC=CAM_ASM_000379 /LENGTH=190 /DNA_ID=CAMNT_0028197549 /DNA_START=26 /DNA_END=598 /DNA_ORIENTATION=+